RVPGPARPPPVLQPLRLALLRGPGRAVPPHRAVVPPGAAVEPGLLRRRGRPGQPPVPRPGPDVPAAPAPGHDRGLQALAAGRLLLPPRRPPPPGPPAPRLLRGRAPVGPRLRPVRLPGPPLLRGPLHLHRRQPVPLPAVELRPRPV